MHILKKNVLISIIIMSLIVIGCFYVYKSDNTYDKNVKSETDHTYTISSNDKNIEIPAVSIKDYEGGWTGKNSTVFDISSININPINTNQFSFVISSISGANDASFEGLANIKDDKADGIFNDDSLIDCNIKFSFDKNIIKLENTSKSEVICLGVGTYFDGEYARDVKLKEVSVENVFEEEIKFEEFKRLVGNDIKLFNNTAQSIFEVKDLDNINAKVNISSVRGLGKIMESIIMVDPTGKIWAAVIDSDKKVIRYYTNVFAYKNSLPKTIQEWEKDVGLKVVYQQKEYQNIYHKEILNASLEFEKIWKTYDQKKISEYLKTIYSEKELKESSSFIKDILQGTGDASSPETLSDPIEKYILFYLGFQGPIIKEITDKNYYIYPQKDESVITIKLSDDSELNFIKSNNKWYVDVMKMEIKPSY